MVYVYVHPNKHLTMEKINNCDTSVPYSKAIAHEAQKVSNDDRECAQIKRLGNLTPTAFDKRKPNNKNNKSLFSRLHVTCYAFCGAQHISSWCGLVVVCKFKIINACIDSMRSLRLIHSLLRLQIIYCSATICDDGWRWRVVFRVCFQPVRDQTI